MGAELPLLSNKEFEVRLRKCSPQKLSSLQIERLFLHYCELRIWNRRLSLVGPGTAHNVVERHYGESLAALPLIGDKAQNLVDIGSGAGFPGLVLAVARPDLGVHLVEAQERKWSFLMSVCRKASLSCKCLNARVGAKPVEGLPSSIDIVTARAVGIRDLGFAKVLPQLSTEGVLLLWCGAEQPELPEGFAPVRESWLHGAQQRRILEIVQEDPDDKKT